MDLLLEEIADTDRGRKEIIFQTELVVRGSAGVLKEKESRSALHPSE
jgi:hypothetical protein